MCCTTGTMWRILDKGTGHEVCYSDDNNKYCVKLYIFPEENPAITHYFPCNSASKASSKKEKNPSNKIKGQQKRNGGREKRNPRWKLSPSYFFSNALPHSPKHIQCHILNRSFILSFNFNSWHFCLRLWEPAVSVYHRVWLQSKFLNIYIICLNNEESCSILFFLIGSLFYRIISQVIRTV